MSLARCAVPCRATPPPKPPHPPSLSLPSGTQLADRWDRWVAWGTQNRETPLRKIEGSHWELKCLDGLANPYLALAAVLLAGARGVADGERLVWADCEIDPATLTENDRKELHVSEMLPASVEEALRALGEDEGLSDMLGAELVEKYTAVKEFELKLLSSLKEEERRKWIMERY